MNNDHWLDYLVSLMNELHDDTGVIVNTFGNDPMEGSIAAKERIIKDNSEKLLTAYSQGSIMFEVVMDHFSSLSRSLTQPIHTVSPWTTMRSILESSAIGLWLLDTKIDPDERISRSLKFRCEGLFQQVKYGKATLDNDNEIEPIINRYKEVLVEAEALGFEIARYDTGKLEHLRHEMPSVTDLISSQLNLEGEYRLFSAIAHAHLWALQALSFKKADIPGKLLLEKNLSIEAIQYVGALVFRASSIPIIEKCKLFGWPHKGLKDRFISAQAEFLRTVNIVMEN